jgi:PKD repeat protein
MWTYRDFYGATPSATGVAGVAYDDGICDSQYKYHVCELSRPGATINLSLITITHEIGHNFSAIHVSSPATAIMNSTSGEGNVDWDSGTISLISNKINSAACLNDCSLHTPEVYFEADKKYGCNNLTVNFKDKSDFNPTSWSWNFGDGTPNSSMQNPTHTFNSPGLYNVTLTASNANGSSTSTMTGFIQVGVGSYPVTQVIPVTKTSGTGGYHVNTTTAWMTFDAITDLEIVALDIDAQTAGPRWFYLAQDTGHKILESKVVNLNAGLQKVYFNWKVPQGSKYNLAVSYGKGTDWYNQLYRLSSGVSLPKTIPGLINVNSNFPLDQGNTAGASAWYIGFNWEVRGVCSSSTGIFDNENSSEINIFPNPAIDLVIIKLTDKNYSQIKVFDTKGSVVNCEISENEGEIMLNVANWQSGIYLTEIIYPNGRIIKRKLNVVNP